MTHRTQKLSKLRRRAHQARGVKFGTARKSSGSGRQLNQIFQIVRDLFKEKLIDWGVRLEHSSVWIFREFRTGLVGKLSLFRILRPIVLSCVSSVSPLTDCLCFFRVLFVLSGKLYVQKRTMIKDYCPGYYDPTAGGVVQFEESYEHVLSAWKHI